MRVKDKQNITEKKSLPLSIRRAQYEDIDDLTMISRLCYPDLLRWRGPRFHGRKLWRRLLDAEHSEAWVCSSHGQTIGYFTLILNKQQHDEVNGKHPCGLFAGLYMLVTCPKLFSRIALKKLKRYSIKSLRKLVGTPSDHSKRLASKRLKKLFERQIPWVGYIAVVPKMQAQGVATEMLKFCVQRAIKLGHKEIWAHVEQRNIRARGLMRKLGFVMTEEIVHLLFVKQL